MAAVGARSRHVTKNGRSELHLYLLDFEYRDVSSSNFHILVIDTGHSMASSPFPALRLGKDYILLCVIVMVGPGSRMWLPREPPQEPLAIGMSSRAHCSPRATSIFNLQPQHLCTVFVLEPDDRKRGWSLRFK